jgi:hypothetical protein
MNPMRVEPSSAAGSEAKAPERQAGLRKSGADTVNLGPPFHEMIMINRKTWFVSYRLQPRIRAGHARTSKTFESESEAKAFAHELPPAVRDVTAGTINPHVPKKFYGSAQIFKWLAHDRSKD